MASAHHFSKVKGAGRTWVHRKIPYPGLGINAVELLPVQEFFVDDFLKDKGLTNYWGYNTIGFFAPESSYGTGRSPGCQVEEFKTLVRELHKAGIEVIMDVVYNHTGEGNEQGPTLCLKGVDNPTYYRLTGTPTHPYRYYMNSTGCGNTVDFASAQVIRFVMDSLRYWADVMHVDGFRFDLASVLGRNESDMYYKGAAFFDAVSQDSGAQPCEADCGAWDPAYTRWQLPVDWSEWNGRFRDTMRRFGKGDRQLQSWDAVDGSADLYGDDGGAAYNSINFITCHDGFTPQRPCLLRQEAQRRQQGEQLGRDERQQLVVLRGGRRYRGRGHNKPSQADYEEPFLPPAVLLWHTDGIGRRRVHAHSGRQQQRLLPGQRDKLVRLGTGAEELGDGLLLHEGREFHEDLSHPPAPQVLYRQ
jgi:glycogen debranching enzyme GlgX